MASITDTSATKALNEEEYLNKLYDTKQENQKQVLDSNYQDAGTQLDTMERQNQAKTDEYLERTDVEAQRAQQLYTPTASKLSGGAQTQAALSMNNTKQRNVSALQGQQRDAQAEIQRQRQLRAQQYEAQIRQAQADNDMERAQALYEAAKTEDAEFRNLQQQAATIMAQRGDMSIAEGMLNGTAPERMTSGKTWDGVLDDEEAINAIYDAKLESAKVQRDMDAAKQMSDLQAQQQEQQRKTVEALNEAYVNGLKGQRNYDEVQTAYGQGSGTGAAARLSRGNETLKEMTDLRKLQLGKDAEAGQTGYGIMEVIREHAAKEQAAVDSERVNALYGAADEKEAQLIEDQKFLGEMYRDKNNDWSILGALYGLTPDQMDRLMGRGAYGYTEEKKSGGSGLTLSKALENYYGTPNNTIGGNRQMTQEQVTQLYQKLDAAAKIDAAKKEQDAFMEAIVAGNKAAARNNKK